MPTSSVDSFLPRDSLMELNRENVSSGKTFESNWKPAAGHSSVTGYVITQTAGSSVSATLTIEQTIDGPTESTREVDISDTKSADAQESVSPVEIPLLGKYVRAQLDVNADADKVRVVIERSTRVSAL